MEYAQFRQKFLALTLPPVSPDFKIGLPVLIAAILVIGLMVAWLPLPLAVLVVGGGIFFPLVLLRPTLILYLLIPAIPFGGLVSIDIGGARAGVMELLLVLGAALWLVKLLTSQTVTGQPARLYTGPLLVPLLLFLGSALLSWLNTFSIRASLIETIKWVEVFLLYLFIFNLLPKQEIKWVVLVIILTGAAQAVLGLYQFIFKVGPAGFLLFNGSFLRAYGTFAQPNPYGGYLGLVLPLALSLMIWSLEPGTGAELRRGPGLAGTILPVALPIALGLSVLLMMAALFASQSRGAWLGFAVASVVTVIVRSKKMMMLFIALLLLATLSGLVGSFELGSTQTGPTTANRVYTAVTQRFVDALAIFTVTDVAITPVTDANFATIERLAHWQAAREMWRDHPWLGVGFGNYAAIYPGYAVGRWQDPLGHAHNYLLNLGAEMGLAGIVAYLIFWFWTFGLSLNVIVNSRGFYKAVAVGATGIFTHLQIHNLVDNLYVQGMYLHLAIIIGVVAVMRRLYRPAGRSENILESQTVV